jgi:hypothetical protein
MSAAKDQGGREHVGDEYVTYNIHKEGRPRSDFPPFPPSSEEEEEAHKEAERRAEREAKHEAKRMLGEDMGDQRELVRLPWNQRQPSCRYSTIW